NDIARLELDVFAGQSSVDVGRRNGIVRGQLGDIPRCGNVEEHAASDDRGNGDGVALKNAEIAAPVGLFETVVPVMIVTRGHMAEAVDLRGDVIVDEESVAVPAR